MYSIKFQKAENLKSPGMSGKQYLETENCGFITVRESMSEKLTEHQFLVDMNDFSNFCGDWILIDFGSSPQSYICTL